MAELTYQQKKELERQSRARKSRIRKAKRFALYGIILLAIAGGLYWFVDYSRSYQENLPGVFVAEQSREHIAVGADHPEYSSIPPTSGWHYENPAKSAVYKNPIDDGYVIHAMEHGRVVLNYKPGINATIISELEAIGEDFGCPVIVRPYPKLDNDIALTAWTRIDKFAIAEYSKERIERFIKAFRFKGPEMVPCSQDGIHVEDEE